MSIFDQSFPRTAGGLGCFPRSSQPNSSSRHGNFTASEHRQVLTGEDQQKKQEIDTLLSEAFNNLTFEERQVQQEELHGVANEIAEEASIVENSLLDLESHIQKKKAGRMYETAERMSPGYVNSRAFRLMFLRANRYDTKAAADMMMKFFDEKQKLFGTERLTKEITIDDLDEDDIACMKSGAMQWAGRDSRNRPIFLNLPGLRNYKYIQNELRYRFFVMMEASKSPENQIRGVVFLMYAIGDMRDSRNGQGYRENSNLATAIPIYTAAFHFVSDDLKQYLLGSAVVPIMPANLRARSRFHLGTHLECQYLLSSYGIQVGLLPFSPETNSVMLESHLRWCQKHISNSFVRTKNQLVPEPIPSSSGGLIIEPNPNDVLSSGFTKGDNIGNDRLRALVKDSVEAYRSGSTDEKLLIVDRIIGEIHKAGGRFLQQDKGSQTWYELSLTKVRLKITQRIRNHKRQRETASRQARDGTPVADMPRPCDVIFGKHQRGQGNVFLHCLVKDRFEEYESLDRGMKVVIVDAIIERIKSEGGRFLQPIPDTEGYVELSTDSIRGRLSTYFRNYRRSVRNGATR